MTFKELRASFPIYMLSKGEELKFTQLKTIDVSLPRVNTGVAFSMNNGIQPLIVDVTVENEGQRVTYNIPENVTAYAVSSNTIIATTKDDILRELQATKCDCEEYLSNVEKRKEKLSQCNKLIGELDTAYRDKQVMEKRLADYEEKQKAVEDKLDKILSEISKYRKQ